MINFARKSFIDSWIEGHPLIIWLLQHPLISLIITLSIAILSFRLVAAIVQLLDKLWIWLLKSPLLLIKSIFGFTSKSSEKIVVIEPRKLTIETEKIAKIIQQLEIIDRQQRQIIEDIAILKKKQES